MLGRHAVLQPLRPSSQANRLSLSSGHTLLQSEAMALIPRTPFSRHCTLRVLVPVSPPTTPFFLSLKPTRPSDPFLPVARVGCAEHPCLDKRPRTEVVPSILPWPGCSSLWLPQGSFSISGTGTSERKPYSKIGASQRQGQQRKHLPCSQQTQVQSQYSIGSPEHL